MGQTRPLFRLFLVFSNKQYIFYTKSMLKMSCPSSIRRWDSNPRPLERESPPITTRPGLPPNDFRVIIYEHKMFVRLATWLPWRWGFECKHWIIFGRSIALSIYFKAHSDSLQSTALTPRVRIPSKPSMLFHKLIDTHIRHWFVKVTNCKIKWCTLTFTDWIVLQQFWASFTDKKWCNGQY